MPHPNFILSKEYISIDQLIKLYESKIDIQSIFDCAKGESISLYIMNEHKYFKLYNVRDLSKAEEIDIRDSVLEELAEIEEYISNK